MNRKAQTAPRRRPQRKGVPTAGQRRNRKINRETGAVRRTPREDRQAVVRESRWASVQERSSGGWLSRLKLGRLTAFASERGDLGRRFLSIGLRLGLAGGLAYGALFVAQGIYAYATTSPRFEAKHLVYEPTPHVPHDELVRLLELQPGTNILSLDLGELSAKLTEHPWVARASVTRELPDTLLVEVEEHTARAVVLAGRFYLANGEGHLFKPVDDGERGRLPIITGLERADLVADRDGTEAQVAEAMKVLDLYAAKQRPRLSEIHLGAQGEITLYTEEAGTQIRLGRGDLEGRLERFDALRAALGPKADRLAVVHLDHTLGPGRDDRIVARFMSPEDEASVVAAAQPEAPPAEATDKPAVVVPPTETQDRAPKKRRIPRAY